MAGLGNESRFSVLSLSERGLLLLLDLKLKGFGLLGSSLSRIQEYPQDGWHQHKREREKDRERPDLGYAPGSGGALFFTVAFIP